MAEVATFFDPPPPRRRRGRGGPLVPIDLTRGCPACGAPLDTETAGQLPLLRHGGYGATRSTTTVTCSRCTWSLVTVVAEERPPRRTR